LLRRPLNHLAAVAGGSNRCCVVFGRCGERKEREKRNDLGFGRGGRRGRVFVSPIRALHRSMMINGQDRRAPCRAESGPGGAALSRARPRLCPGRGKWPVSGLDG
jgi:hypothetical protein